MVKALSFNTTLRAIRMSDAGENAQGIELLGGYLMQNAHCRIVSIDLCGTPLGNVEAFSQAIAR
jgi:hypothetical protein